MVASPADWSVRRKERDSGRHAEGHLLSIEIADWMPANRRGVVDGRLTTGSNEPGDIGFVTVVHERPDVQPLAAKRRLTAESSSKTTGQRS
jgi:hypothetical protein